MQEHGYRIIPVNPRYAEILGERCYPSLRGRSREPVDMVDCLPQAPRTCRRSRDEAIAIGAKLPVAADRRRATRGRRAGARAGPGSVMDRCVKIEHARLFGGLQLGRRQHRRDLGARGRSDAHGRRWPTASSASRPWPPRRARSPTRPPARARCRSTRRPASCSTAPTTPRACSTCRPSATSIRACRTPPSRCSRSAWRRSKAAARRWPAPPAWRPRRWRC